MKIKTAELTNTALDWLVARARGAKGLRWHTLKDYGSQSSVLVVDWEFDWSELSDLNYAYDGDAIKQVIEEQELSVGPIYEGGKLFGWEAFSHKTLKWDSRGEFIYGSDHRVNGPTPGHAVMRCLVSIKFGAEVEVPGELL